MQTKVSKRVSILTLFPEFFESPLKTSLLGRAIQDSKLEVQLVSLREFGEGKYRAVDDRPFGGGPGMVLMPAVLEKAFERVGVSPRILGVQPENSPQSVRPHVVYLSPQGSKLTATRARELAQLPSDVVVLCGHYEGVDERVIDAFVDEQISIGDYVLTGGEPAAVVLLDAISRFVPGVVGEQGSVDQDTFEAGPEQIAGGLKAPMYTRPQSWQGREVPSVLLSGNHGEISAWRRYESEHRTIAKRPDLVTESSGALVAKTVERDLYILLLHSPMVDKQGKVVTTAVTNLDIHDIARSSRTYGAKKYYIVNPEPEQERLVKAILGHWDEEVSKVYHPARAQALGLVCFHRTFEEVFNEISFESGQAPWVAMPDARDLSGYFSPEKIWSYESFRKRISDPQGLEGGRRRPVLIVFGTGWGIAPEFFKHVDSVLKPLRQERKSNKYNHLSVRAAAAIVMDRLFGSRD